MYFKAILGTFVHLVSHFSFILQSWRQYQKLPCTKYNSMKHGEEQHSKPVMVTLQARYLTPNFLTYFPVVMESTEEEERLSWNEVSGLFWRRDTIPATFIDENLLVEQIDLDVFGKPDSMEIAERRALALFKLITDEGDWYALTVVYIPYYQKRMDMKTALQAVFTRPMGMPLP